MNLVEKNISREKVEIILEWCINKFGKSEFVKKMPKLRVCNSKGLSYGKNGLYGCYDYKKNFISVFLENINSYKNLCEVVAHEYKHYLLNNKEFVKILKDMRKKGFDEEYISFYHPHELKSCRFEKYWGNVCFNELKNQLYKK
jgi:hypothetical protein